MSNYFFDVNGTIFTNSLSISDAFGKPHADLLKAIRKISIANKGTHFVKSEFTNGRNRKYPGYAIDSVGFSCLMTSSTFRNRASVCAMFAESLGSEKPLIIEAEVRHEERFFLLLKSAVDATQIEDKKITRQFNVGAYRLDFYIKSENFIIEYDEDYHTSQQDKDLLRMAFVSDSLTTTCELTGVTSKPKVVRVRKGHEGKGIVDIISMLMSGVITECVLDVP